MDDLLPPTAIDAERCVLGSLLLCDGNEEVWADVTSKLSPDSFTEVDNQEIYRVLLDMRKIGQKVDAVSLRSELDRRRRLMDIGGVPFIMSLLNSTPSWNNAGSYAAAVQDCYTRRQIIALAEGLKSRAYAPKQAEPTADILEIGRRRLAELLEQGTPARYTSIGEMAERVYRSIGNVGASDVYVPTGYGALDAAIGGLGFGECWLLAARPSMGKSTLARNIARNIVAAGVPVGFISLEETQEKMARNLLSAECAIENGKLRTGRTSLVEQEWDAIYEGVQQLRGLPLYLCDQARKMADIRAIAMAMMSRSGVRVLMIDYLQRIRGYSGDRFEQVTAASIDVSDLAKITKAAVLCLAQLNRAVEGRTDKRPTMGDLRESGQIEQDADGILFLHRESYYNATMAAMGNTDSELIVAKARDAERNQTVNLGTELRFQRFVNLSGPQQPPQDDLDPF